MLLNRIKEWLTKQDFQSTPSPLGEPEFEQLSTEIAEALSEPDPYPPIRNPSAGDLHVDIDIIDKCNLKCPTCFRGAGAQKNTSATMPLPQFREIMAKVAQEGYPNVSLINWTEPFLCKTLDQYVSEVGQHGIECWLSSNLSLPPQQYAESMIKTLAAGVDILFVSVSGFSQDVYQINHVGGRVDWIKENLRILAEARRQRRFTTSIWLRYLEWPYNSHEKADWITFCDELGLGFDPIPAHGDPLKPLPGAADYGKELDLKLTGRPRNAPSLTAGKLPTKICGLIADRVAIDAKGDVNLCCAFPNEPRLRIGQYTALSDDELLLLRLEHQYCRTCGIPPRDATEQDRTRILKALTARAT